MTDIYIIANPKGGAGKSTLGDEILAPQLNEKHENFQHIKICCEEAGNWNLKAKHFTTKNDYNAIPERIFESIFNTDACIIEVGTGPALKNIQAYLSLATLQTIDLRPTVIIPVSSCDQKLTGAISALKTLKSDGEKTFHRFETKIIYTSYIKNECDLIEEDTIALCKKIANRWDIKYAGEIPYFAGFNRRACHEKAWIEILKSPDTYMRKVMNENMKKRLAGSGVDTTLHDSVLLSDSFHQIDAIARASQIIM